MTDAGCKLDHVSELYAICRGDGMYAYTVEFTPENTARVTCYGLDDYDNTIRMLSRGTLQDKIVYQDGIVKKVKVNFQTFFCDEIHLLGKYGILFKIGEYFTLYSSVPSKAPYYGIVTRKLKYGLEFTTLTYTRLVETAKSVDKKPKDIKARVYTCEFKTPYGIIPVDLYFQTDKKSWFPYTRKLIRKLKNTIWYTPVPERVSLRVVSVNNTFTSALVFLHYKDCVRVLDLRSNSTYISPKVNYQGTALFVAQDMVFYTDNAGWIGQADSLDPEDLKLIQQRISSNRKMD